MYIYIVSIYIFWSDIYLIYTLQKLLYLFRQIAVVRFIIFRG